MPVASCGTESLLESTLFYGINEIQFGFTAKQQLLDSSFTFVIRNTVFSLLEGLTSLFTRKRLLISESHPEMGM